MKISRYRHALTEVSSLLEHARTASARSVNAVMTATYFLIGRRIVEEEQRGGKRAEYYGEQLIDRLAVDLTKRFGRGFSRRNLFLMRSFFLDHAENIVQTPSAQSFPLPWSHYARLLSVKSADARRWYEREALAGGWTHAQLDRQIQTQFYERSVLSKKRLKSDAELTAADVFKEPYLLEFLDLKDEYSENDFEAALVMKLEAFLLELGTEFAFIGRQKRLRIGDEWYRVDLLLFHRRLRCLVIVDLKLGKFSHADSGQMHVYLTYARAHWMLPGENPPVGLILCAQADEALARYALDGLPTQMLAAEYRTVLPSEAVLVRQLEKARAELRALPAKVA